LKIGPLESEKIIIGYLKSEIGSPHVHTGCLTFSLNKHAKTERLVVLHDLQ